MNVESRHAWLIVLPALALPGCRTPEQTEARLQRKEELRAAQEERREQAKAEKEGRAPVERCAAYVYRKRSAVEYGFRPVVYVGEDRIAGLGRGDSRCLRLPPGKYTVSVKRSIAGAPTWTIRTAEIEVTEVATLYIRFSEVVTAVAGSAILTSATLDLVTEDLWRERQ